MKTDAKPAPCRGLVHLLSHLLDDSAAPLAPETRRAVQAGSLPVPTSRALLAPAGRCLYASSAASRGVLSRQVQLRETRSVLIWRAMNVQSKCHGVLSPHHGLCGTTDTYNLPYMLPPRHRLPPGALTVTHPRLPTPLCRALGMAPLHQVVTEQLDPAHPLQPVTSIHGTTAAAVAARLRHPGFAAAVHDVLRAASGSAGTAGGPPGEPPAAQLPLLAGEVQALMGEAAAALQFVEGCRTQLVLAAGGGGASTGVNMPLEGSSAQVR